MTSRRVLLIPCVVVAATASVGALLATTVTTRVTWTCVQCRAECEDRTFLGCLWQFHRDTPFTAWHDTHRPQHEHAWTRLTCTRGSSLFGTTTFFACGPRHPVCDVPPEMLRRFAEQAGAETLAEYFDKIGSADQKVRERAVKLVEASLLKNE
jgi:hypothetical protein